MKNHYICISLIMFFSSMLDCSITISITVLAFCFYILYCDIASGVGCKGVKELAKGSQIYSTCMCPFSKWTICIRIFTSSSSNRLWFLI